MDTQANSTPILSAHSPDERTTAALAHGSAVLNFFTGIGGPIAALVIWLTQKEKSPWAAYHALQSLIFQAAVLVVTVIVVAVVWAAGFLISFVTLGIGTFVALPVMIAVFFGGFILVGAAAFYGLYAATQVYQGREFSYMWIGDWLKGRSPGQ